MKKKKLIETLKSGNFTIAYHDNCFCTLHIGKFTYDELPTDKHGELISKHTFGEYDGYAPDEVKLLAEALGGKVVSI